MTSPELPLPWRRWVAEAPHPERAAGALNRLLEIRAVPRSPTLEMGRALARVLGSSLAVGRWARTDPRVVGVLTEPDLERPRTLTTYRQAFSGGPSLDPRAHLRKVGHLELARIVAREVLGLATVMTAAAEISALAQAAVEVALSVALKELEVRFGPCFDLLGGPNGVCVLGMGKLAGSELNPSSDVDLVFLHADAGGGTTGGSDGVLDPAGFHCRVVARVADLLGAVTDGGVLFRVDLGLRPEGRNGAPSQALDQAVQHYLTWGQTWERAVLAKARPVAGHLGLGERFLAEVEPFVYRRSLDYTTVEDLQDMKGRIEAAALGRSGGRDDLKRGPGGIREVEFFVQTHQLIHGGRAPHVRCANTVEALDRLSEAGIVEAGVARGLGAGYRFLRKVEHAIQAVEFRQTHRLPDGGPELRALGRRLGFDTPEAFSTALAEVRQGVHREYLALFRGAVPPVGVRAARALLQLEVGAPGAEARIREAGFREPARALAGLALLRDGTGRRAPSPRARRNLDRVAPVLLEAVASGPNPDRALHHLGMFLAGSGARAGYLALLAENPDTARILVRLFGTSDFLSLYLIRRPELLDELVLGNVSLPVETAEDLSESLNRALAACVDEEEALDAFRRFRNVEFLRVALHDLWGGLPPEAVGRQLTRVAEACLGAALARVRGRMEARYGLPMEAGGASARFSVLAQGKLGGGEIDYHSDLDLVFLYSAPGATGKKRTNGEFYARMAQRLIGLLTTRTREGIVFRTDTRLRPSGRAGPLVSSLGAFVSYHDRGARVWEQQALLRMRPVAGDAELGRQVRAAVDRILFAEPPAEDPRSEILRMRGRLEREVVGRARDRVDVKAGPGGIVDVEFAVQALQLLHGWRVADLRSPGTIEALEALCRHGYLPEAEGVVLGRGYRFLRSVEARLRIQGDRSTDNLPDGPEPLEDLARGLGFKRGEDLSEEVRRCMEAVRRSFDTVMGRR